MQKNLVTVIRCQERDLAHSSKLDRRTFHGCLLEFEQDVKSVHIHAQCYLLSSTPYKLSFWQY